MESEIANLAIESDEKQQTGWYDLPYEMRIMIIEMMDTKTRGKFSSCSKLCCKEVRGSKNYINYISIRGGHFGIDEITIRIRYGDYSSENVFSKITGNKKEQCLISFNGSFGNINRKHEKIVDRSMKDAVSEYFNRFVNDAIHLRRIAIESRIFPFAKTSIAHLSKLTIIKIWENGPIDLLKCGFLSIDQLSASNFVNIEATNIEIDQLINFRASEIILRKVTFSPKQLNQYLKSWNNSEIHENVVTIKIDCNLYKYADDIVSGLEVVSREKGFGDKWFYIKNSVGRLARLRIFFNTISVDFNVYISANYMINSYDSDD